MFLCKFSVNRHVPSRLSHHPCWRSVNRKSSCCPHEKCTRRRIRCGCRGTNYSDSLKPAGGCDPIRAA
ncbi:hypothetical protein Hanom_Chr11g01008321 [Helianthus anomalus]